MNMKKSLVLLLGVGIWLPGVTWALPSAGVDTVESLGKFVIRLTPEVAEVWRYDPNKPNDPRVDYCPNQPPQPGKDDSQCLLESPLLYDSETTIGRSEPFLHKDADEEGVKICQGGTFDFCSGGFLHDISDASFEGYPDEDSQSNFKQGPEGVEEIHTQILKLNLVDNGNCGTVSKTAVRLAENPLSIGEVEEKQTGSGLESFFRIFVQVDLDLLPGNDGPEMTLYNDEPNDEPLIITSQPQKLPPQIIYTHDGSDNAPILRILSVHSSVENYLNDKARHVLQLGPGDNYFIPHREIGWLTLAGHGTGYSCDGIAPASVGDTLLTKEDFLEQFETFSEMEQLKPINCDGGVGWVEKCPSGFDFFGGKATILIDWLDNPGDPAGEADFKVQLEDRSITVLREKTVAESGVLQTEIIELNMTGDSSKGQIVLRSGDGKPNLECDDKQLCSFGTIETSSDPEIAQGEFKVAFSMEIGDAAEKLQPCNEDDKLALSAPEILELPLNEVEFVIPEEEKKPIALCHPGDETPIAYLMDAILGSRDEFFGASDSQCEGLATYSNDTREANLPCVEAPLYTDISGQALEEVGMGLYSALLQIPFGFSDFEVKELSFLEILGESSAEHAKFVPDEGRLEIPKIKVPTVIPHAGSTPTPGPDVYCHAQLQQSVLRSEVFSLTEYGCHLEEESTE